MRKILLSAVCFAMIVSSANAQSRVEGHPLITPYEGSKLTNGTAKDFEEYKLVTGVTDKGLKGAAYKGKLTRLWYANPAGRSALEVYTNYVQAFAKAGAKEIWSCSEKACGPAYSRSAWNRYNGIGNSITEPGARYLAAQISNGAGTAYIGLSVGDRTTQIDILEVAQMETGKVSVDAEALGKGLDADGYVVVEGIFFDTDKATLKPESKPALDEVAKLLTAQPALKLYVVGHTDMQGQFTHNMSLSEARAQAVAQALVANYKVDAERLEGHGVGPLVPSSTNATEAGRAKNRRVVLVAKLDK